ncbi:hypothetical protein OP10G_2000 [Fimbriimonas ginsengisoli Gsoil 348]|uniref:Uncharacterized protein n=1 Tax=Fimbriimonas ginsengisoli Gsoil 348 TaxID=661478 RepID=A0A068NP82_FIMGI|nr:hypothetical protein OP10G_2000 [Fimbriimonas ginsengisoli Gsoil 348]
MQASFKRNLPWQFQEVFQICFAQSMKFCRSLSRRWWGLGKGMPDLVNDRRGIRFAKHLNFT